MLSCRSLSVELLTGRKHLMLSLFSLRLWSAWPVFGSPTPSWSGAWIKHIALTIRKLVERQGRARARLSSATSLLCSDALPLIRSHPWRNCYVNAELFLQRSSFFYWAEHVPDKEEHQNTIRESDRRDRGWNKGSRERWRGTLFFLPVPFLQMLKCPFSWRSFNSPQQRLRRRRETHDELSTSSSDSSHSQQVCDMLMYGN